MRTTHTKSNCRKLVAHPVRPVAFAAQSFRPCCPASVRSPAANRRGRVSVRATALQLRPPLIDTVLQPGAGAGAAAQAGKNERPLIFCAPSSAFFCAAHSLICSLYSLASERTNERKREREKQNCCAFAVHQICVFARGCAKEKQQQQQQLKASASSSSLHLRRHRRRTSGRRRRRRSVPKAQQ